jgi:RND family efflux transporter MFP subunit
MTPSASPTTPLLPLPETNGHPAAPESPAYPPTARPGDNLPTKGIATDTVQPLDLATLDTAELPVPPARRFPWWIVIVGLLVLAGGAVAALRWWPASGSDQQDITAIVTKQTLDIHVNERGDLESAKSVQVQCEVEGEKSKIIEILPEGTRVTKDQVVLRFDVDELTRQYAEQQIKWKQADGKAKAAKEELEVQKNKAESEIAQAQLKLDLAVLDRDKYMQGEYQVEVDDKQGAIALAKRDLQEAEEKLEHYRNFVKKGFGTPEQLRLKEAEVAKARYYLSRDEAKLKVLQDYTRKRQEAELTAKADDAKRELSRTRSSMAAAIAKAESELEAAQVTANLEKERMERIKKQLDKAVVKAPQDGILVYSNARYWDPNSRIQPGSYVHFQQPLFSLPDLSKMQVKVKVHESVVKKVKVGQQAEITLEALPNLKLKGTIKSVATLADNANPWDERGVKEYVTVVTIDNLPPDAEIKPGMTGEVKIHVNSLPNSLVVPVQAVTEHEGKQYAYVLAGTEVQKREVTLGESNNAFVAVKEGLKEGEKVVFNARARLLKELRKGKENSPEGAAATK